MSFWKKESTQKVLASLISILIGLVVGAIVVLIVGIFNKSISLKGAWEGIRLIFIGILSTGRDAKGALTWGFNPASIGNMLFRATPLVMTGLSVALAFKTGLFNIGAPGQYLMGTLATLFIALSIPSGALPVPGLVKAFLNINEVLACIMTNWIAANLVTWAFDVSKLKNMVEGTKSGYIYKTTYGLVDGTYVDGAGVATTKLGLNKIFPGSQINAGILVAILLAVGVYILISKTTLGYELKACGANRHAARYAGIHDKRNIVLSMALSGGLAAAGASLYFLSGNTEFFWSTYQSLPAAGFNGIPVALLALNNPLGVIFSAIFMAMLDVVGLQLTNLTAYNEYITNVIIAVIVYLSAFSLAIRMLISGKRKKREKRAEDKAAPPAPPEDKAAGDKAESAKGGENA